MKVGIQLAMPLAPSYNRSFLHSKYIWCFVLLGIFSIQVIYRTAQSRIWQPDTIAPSTAPAASNMSEAASHSKSPSRMPVYFLGIGGPNFMEAKDHPAFLKLGETGREITTKVKPKAVVVFSAHWQHGPSTVAVNVAEKTDLIYDFYGFPPHYYEYEYPNKGSREVAEKVIEELSIAGIGVDRVHRGLDHGVWVGFLAAFDPKKNPLNVPIVQVSLLGNEDPDQHYRIGRALEQLRDEGVLIIGAGMAVHNLHDFRKAKSNGKVMPYASSFEEGVKEAVAVEPEGRQAAMTALLKRSDAKAAHPSLEHILPIHVAAGAAGLDMGERLWALPEGSLNWAQYRFGAVEAA